MPLDENDVFDWSVLDRSQMLLWLTHMLTEGDDPDSLECMHIPWHR
jgi:hypothetical protein